MADIIDLVISKENVFVWTAKDWLILRRDHRIIGELIGCLPKHPRQDVMLGLPLLLLPEEVTLLLEKGLARIIQYSCFQQSPTESLKQMFDEYREKLFHDQETCLREQRKKQIIAVMDKIVEGKRRKRLGIGTSKKKLKKPLNAKDQETLSNIEINTTHLLNEEIAKLPKLEKSDALIQTFTAYPWPKKDNGRIIEWKYPSRPDEILRYKTYKDLWERGYYVTTGEKFGGDFLAYPGDPIIFHSQFIICCKRRDEDIAVAEVIGQSRIGCHVRKTQTFAVLSEDGESVKYQCFQWADSNIIQKC